MGSNGLCAADTVFLTRDGKTTSGTAPAPNTVIAAMHLGRIAPSQSDGAVMLKDGARLVGIPVSINTKDVVVRCDRLGLKTFPVENVAQLLLAPGSGRAAEPGFTGAIFINGDSLAGGIAFLDETNLGLNTGKRVVSIPRSRVAQVILAAGGRGGDGWRLLLDSGDRLLGRMEGGRAWTFTGAAGSMTLGDSWSCAWYQGPEARPLTSLALHGLTAATAVDRYHDGRPLAVQGRPYGHGLAVRGTAQIRVAIEGASRFMGEVAALQGRDVAVTLSVDGREVWSGRPLTEQGPIPIDAVLGAGTELSVVIAAPMASGAPLVVLGWPTLVR